MADIRLEVTDFIATIILDRPAALNAFTLAMGAELTAAFDACDQDDSVRAVVLTGEGRAFCSSWFLPRLVPMQTALDWVYSGRLVEAAEAHQAGLFSALYPADDLLEQAYALARRVTEHSAPVSVALSRQMLWRGLGADHPMIAHRVESRGLHHRGASADAREGVTAFLEKRPARFPDRVAELPDIVGDDLPVPPFRD